MKWGKNLHPMNGEGRVGKQGFNKELTIEQVVAIASKMPEKPNIIIKAGVNAKWYIKKCDIANIDLEIKKNRESVYGKNSHRCTLHMLEWNE